MHVRALMRLTRMQPRNRNVARTAPCVHERAVAGTVLQASSVKGVIQRANVGSACEGAHRRVIDALPAVGGSQRTRAVQRRIR